MEWIMLEQVGQSGIVNDMRKTNGGTFTEVAVIPRGLLFRTTIIDDAEGGGLAVALQFVYVPPENIGNDWSKCHEWIEENKL